MATVKITYDDGHESHDTYDIYEYKTGEFLAYRKEGEFGYASKIWSSETTDSWTTVSHKKPADESKLH